jgi:hypothetical protein
MHALAALTVCTTLIAAACAQGPGVAGAEVPPSQVPASDAPPAGAGLPREAPADVGSEQAPAPVAHAWLERIEAAADNTRTLRSKVTLVTRQVLLGDEQRRFGDLAYAAADPAGDTSARFRLDFDRVVVDGQLETQRRSYTFDGVWLAERLEDDRVFIRRQLVGDDAAERPDLDLGDGPFALPLNLRKDKVLQRFTVEHHEPVAGDPANSVHLTLTPRPGVEVEDEQIDVWFDRDKLIPVRVVSLKTDQTEQRLDLREPQVNADLGDAPFDTAPPAEPGWEVQVAPLD